ncbi:AAA family ATPase [Candidatus Woesearchaeota archaeon]|nr:AAA family ATPase [Candidatus Woesearchaeota archaeon]
MILGITGYFASGKDTVAEYLEKKGFIHYSLSDVLRELLKKENKEITRENLQKRGNELRKKEGPDALAKRILKKLKQNNNYIISSVRTLGEIKILKENKDFKLIFVDASLETRFKRILKRNREKDPRTIKELKEMEDFEKNDKKSYGMHLDKCKKEADIIIKNDSSLKVLHKKINKMLEDLEKKNLKNENQTLRKDNIRKRPSKDGYYLNIAKQVSERSTCLSVKMGAVIVRNDQIVSTGYVGAPRGTRDSVEWGFCLRRKLKIPSGHRYELCRSVHAEMNAIINAARAGVSVLDGTMYLYGEKLYKGEGKRIDVFPCFICKKMIINAGIKRFVAGREDGSLKVFNVEDWVKAWQNRDMLDDMDVYDAGEYE